MKMLLAIDVGNTQTVIGLLENDVLMRHWRVATDPRRTADEFMALLRGLFAENSSDTVDGVVACSTVPAVQRELRVMFRRYYENIPSVLVESGEQTGVRIKTDNPSEVGTDRIINAVAAIHSYPGPRIVVDFGTATTFDVISEDGDYLGGAIAPGIEVSLNALGDAGAQLRRVELTKPRTVIGKNTVTALQSGAFFGFSSQVDGLVTRMVAELDKELTDVSVIATGGLAPLVVEESTTIDHHEPWLTLTGLRLVFERVFQRPFNR